MATPAAMAMARARAAERFALLPKGPGTGPFYFRKSRFHSPMAIWATTSKPSPAGLTAAASPARRWRCAARCARRSHVASRAQAAWPRARATVRSRAFRPRPRAPARRANAPRARTSASRSRSRGSRGSRSRRRSESRAPGSPRGRARFALARRAEVALLRAVREVFPLRVLLRPPQCTTRRCCTAPNPSGIRPRKRPSYQFTFSPYCKSLIIICFKSRIVAKKRR